MTHDLTERLIQALEPLAALATKWDDDPAWVGKDPSPDATQIGIGLTLGHAREARAAIAAARECGS